MSKYAIVFFPEISLDNIQNFRKIFDPKAELISPHITLVFPFEKPENDQQLFDEVANKLKVFKTFQVELLGHHLDPEDYFFHLLVNNGEEKIIELHNELYSGMLEKYWRKDLVYTPHMTIGVFTNTEGVFDEQKYHQAEERLKNTDLSTQVNFNSCSIIEIEDSKMPRRVVKTFELSD